MRKILPLLMIAFLAAEFSTAQDTDKSSMERFGLNVGLHYSCMNFNEGVPRPDAHVANTWMTGITVGFMMEVPLINNFSLTPEYAYAQRRGKYERSNTGYSLDYLSMPLLLKYKITPAIAVKAGPQFDLLIHAKQTNSTGDLNITHDTEERNIGAAACIEVRLVKSIFVEARYLHGLSHVGIGQRSGTTEFKYRLVQLDASFKF